MYFIAKIEYDFFLKERKREKIARIYIYSYYYLFKIMRK